MVAILLSLGYLAYTGVQESKSYYVTIKELRGLGDGAYSKHLRVAGNVQPGSIKRSGTKVEFALVENDQLLPVVYSGTEAPPDTFKDNSQAQPMATTVAMAFSTPNNSKPNARQNTHPSRWANRQAAPPCRTSSIH